MIYAIASYSITFSALGLYWALLSARQVELAENQARRTGAAVADPRRGVNVGAFLLAPFWMLAHGMKAPGAMVLLPTLAIVPLVQRELWVPLLFVAGIPIAAGAALAFVGNRIGVAHTGLESPGEFAASQRPWALAGIALHTIVLPWALYFGVLAA